MKKCSIVQYARISIKKDFSDIGTYPFKNKIKIRTNNDKFCTQFTQKLHFVIICMNQLVMVEFAHNLHKKCTLL